MSLYQCDHCGCRENTALGMALGTPTKWFDWTGIEDRKGKHLCSACMPVRYSDGTACSKSGGWHGEFARLFLPMGQFHTNHEGNLEHTESGRTDILAFAIGE